MSTEERDEMPQRPRRTTHSDQEGERKPYNSDYSKPEGSYERRPYRSYGESNRPAYGDRPSRGSYEGGYGNRQGGYGNNNRQGGYNRPSFGNNARSNYSSSSSYEGAGRAYSATPTGEGEQGAVRKRRARVGETRVDYNNDARPTQSYSAPRRQQYDNGGEYGPNRQEGYGNRQGGYNNNRQEGYGNRQGGYGNNRQGGYGNNRQGGYNNNRQGGYGNRQEGYGNRQGGYNNNNNRQGGYGNQGRPNAQRRPNNRQQMPQRPRQIKYQEVLADPMEPIRLNKFLSNAGVCSRREADELIQKGEVKVNGEVITELGTKITRQDQVQLADKPVQIESKVYILLNKPKNCVTTSDDPQERLTVMDLVKNACTERIYPVGRLDRNTTGVLLLTNDGDLASKLTHPSFKKKKIYHVWLDKNVAIEDMEKIANGLALEDGEVHADAISYANEEDKSQVGIEIHSGRNRIVRRIFESLGYHVMKLDRVYFAGLTKKNLGRGKWRYLNEKEVNALRMGAFE